MKLRADLIELWTRAIDYVKSDDYWQNGDGDTYSISMENVILNSATGVRVADIMSKYIAGVGVTNDAIIYDDIYLSDVVRDMAVDLAYQGGFWVHRSIKFNLESESFETDKIEVLDYNKVRKGKTDDDENDGKVWFGDFDTKGWGKKKREWFYPFSANQSVIKAQILADSKDAEEEDIEDKISHYRGQVMYINSTPQFIYALAPLNSVYNDMDTEYRISLYSNGIIREGFLGKLMVLVQGLDEEQTNNIKTKIQGWLGAENTSNVFFSAVESVESLKDTIHIEQIPTTYNDDMFTRTEERIRRNIMGAGGNVPEALLYSNDGGLFSGSGEQIIQLKQFYSENTEYYRTLIEKALFRLGYDSTIITFADQEKIEEDETE